MYIRITQGILKWSTDSQVLLLGDFELIYLGWGLICEITNQLFPENIVCYETF